ncbi:Rgg/GadR/MutR family transcriptional regulator [uncultured Streptococcus sp.]|uniref:Rgg/GadR/MutR family transcriptional regulator n=1 Tax=uncultured Streptococcus sp. TaxID=83427 RepID=UPI0028E63214|nr:Rgg/GadR/MutR family transcriptional regulator [uncultured Streptococcus sp.]
MKKSVELGELYKDLRIARGLKLKDIARDNLSLSQLSKFENGQSMLSADKLLLAITGIHMSFAEFGHALNNYEVSNFFKLGQKIATLFSKQDITGLKNLLIDYKDYEISEIYNQLNLIVIRSSIHSLEPTYAIDEKDKDLLSTYLYSIEEWTEYELYLFTNTMPLLTDEDLIFLSKTFLERDKLYASIPTHQNSSKLTLLNLIGQMIDRKQFYYVKYFSDILEERINYLDMFLIVNLKFLLLLSEYLQGKSENLEAMKKYIETIQELGNPHLADLLQTYLQ